VNNKWHQDQKFERVEKENQQSAPQARNTKHSPLKETHFHETKACAQNVVQACTWHNTKTAKRAENVVTLSSSKTNISAKYSYKVF